MPAPVDPDALGGAITTIIEIASAVGEGNHKRVNLMCRELAEGDQDECAFVLMTFSTMLAKVASTGGADVRKVLTAFGQQSMERAEFLADVLSDLDDMDVADLDGSPD